MTRPGDWRKKCLLGTGAFCVLIVLAPVAESARTNAPARPKELRAPVAVQPEKKAEKQDDSFAFPPAKDLALQSVGARKADALSYYVEGLTFEENGEADKALEAFEKVLDVDPGQIELASRMAYNLIRQENFPRAIDVLKDAIKARPKETGPYLQLAFIYAKYLKKTDQALKYANEALALDSKNIEAYQRLYEIFLTAGEPKKAMQTLDRAAKIDSDDPAYWTHLGKLYAKIIIKPEGQSQPDDLRRVTEVFKKALAHGDKDVAVLRDVADFYAVSGQVQEAIPLYLKVLELQPDDPTAREKLATGFLIINQRAQAVEALTQIIKLHPERYQPYELLGQLLEENGRALEQAGQMKEAKAEFARAIQNYEQSLLINPAQANDYLRLAELLIVHAREFDRAVKVLTEARHRFPDAPQLIYFHAIALREAKKPQEAVTSFEEALHEAQGSADELINGHFYFEYGAAAEQAGLYEKATELFKKSIDLDPANASEAYNYMGFMWVERNSHLDEAADYINKALGMEPNNGAYIDSLGWLYYRQGKYEQALTELLRAAQNLKHDDSSVFEHIADTHAKLNHGPQALEFWQKALVLDPDNKKLAEKIESTKTKLSKGEAPAAKPVQ